MINPEIDDFGNKTWSDSDGFYHREGSPAYEGINGKKIWAIHGEYHREDGPAIEWPNGGRHWFINGKRIQ